MATVNIPSCSWGGRGQDPCYWQMNTTSECTCPGCRTYIQQNHGQGGDQEIPNCRWCSVSNSTMQSVCENATSLFGLNAQCAYLHCAAAWPLSVQQSQLPISPAQSLQCGVSLFSSLSCQSLPLGFSQSLQSGVSLFSSLSNQSLPLGFSQSLQSGVSLFSSLSCQFLPLGFSQSLQSGVSLFGSLSFQCLTFGSTLPV